MPSFPCYFGNGKRLQDHPHALFLGHERKCLNCNKKTAVKPTPQSRICTIHLDILWEQPKLLLFHLVSILCLSRTLKISSYNSFGPLFSFLTILWNLCALYLSFMIFDFNSFCFLFFSSEPLRSYKFNRVCNV